jgi:DNA-binding transcriptional LysR family regulator
MFKYLLIDLSLAQSFAATVRCACFKQAARSLNMRSATLRNQLKKLEANIGEKLFLYQDRALRLTQAGDSLHQELLLRYDNLRSEFEQTTSLRIAVPDMLLHDILGRNLIAFIRKHGGLRVELLPLEGIPTEPADVMIWMADLGSPQPVTTFAMSEPCRLARTRYFAHIASRYSPEGRHPLDLSSFKDYMLVQQGINSQVCAFEPWNTLIEQRRSAVVLAPDREMVRDLIKNSACIGLLPEYTSRLDRNFLALESIFEQEMIREVWLSTIPEAAERDEVKSVVELILTAFAERCKPRRGI